VLEEEIRLAGLPIFHHVFGLRSSDGLDHSFLALRFPSFVLNLGSVVVKEMGVLQPRFFLRVEAVNAALDHHKLSHMDLLGLFHNFSDVFPLELFFVVFKDMFYFQRKENVCPFDDMSLHAVNLDKLQNG
jgi:hypothetical protein